MFPMLMKIILFFSLLAPLMAQRDMWDLPPLLYSDTTATDRVAELEKSWRAENKALSGTTELDRVKQLLETLAVPTTSQILVFSKTSKQNGLIHPGNPRALYFSMDCYVGFVPGGAMEVIIQDTALGPVFYLIDMGHPQRAPRAERDTSDCLSCHGTGRTENVPGMLVRSVFPDENGHALLALGSSLVDHTTPIAERWGGYYVTGSIALPHFGNRTYSEPRTATPQAFHWPDLKGKIDTSKYPHPTSDIVALMLLEHQCKAHNLLSSASMHYRRAHYLAKSLDPEGNPDDGSAGRVADAAAKQIAAWFLFRDEADVGDDGITGLEEFQQAFATSIPKASDGSSLADFQLNSRLFKNRCSYMIYSQAFRSLPDRVRNAVLTEIKHILNSPTPVPGYESMKNSERQRILKILLDTKVIS